MGSLFYAIRPLSSWGTWEKSILGDFVARVRVMSKSGRILQRLVVVTSYSKVTRRYEASRLFVIQSRDRPTLETQTEALTFDDHTDITLCMKRIWI